MRRKIRTKEDVLNVENLEEAEVDGGVQKREGRKRRAVVYHCHILGRP